MEKYIIAGCDLHDESMLVKWALNRGAMHKRSFGNTIEGRKKMISVLKAAAKADGGAQIVLAYEASSLGFGLYDELSEAAIRCHVLAPTRIARSPKHRRAKTDEKDAERILDILRAHLLAGSELPDVWVPDQQTRQDRMIVRRRLQVAGRLSQVKVQIKMLLKQAGLRRPKGLGEGWTNAYKAWLRGLSLSNGAFDYGAALALESLLREMQWLQKELSVQDNNMEALSQGERYAEPVKALTSHKGVGLQSAMVFLTEMGELSRFSNRRQIGAYLGLVPSSYETGEADDRKGHITKQGSWRLRKALCQAAWSRSWSHTGEKAVYERIVARNPKHKKIALVALMRRLAVLMWHIGRQAQSRAQCFDERPRVCSAAKG